MPALIERKRLSMSISQSHAGRLLATALLASLVATGRSVQAQGPAEDVDARTPVYLRGVDPSLPTQATFADWPPAELVERTYWLPWSPQAFQRAALFGLPVFFVLGVNWNRQSHQLTQQTLTDPEVLRSLNQGYIAIRANADLRPDIRERYQTGTWPVVAFLMPNGQPVISNADEESRWAPITVAALDPESLKFLLDEGTVYWNLSPEQLQSAAAKWTSKEGPPPPLSGEVNDAASDQLARWLLAAADRREGGFGPPPRFVVPHLSEYGELLRLRKAPALSEHAAFTVERLGVSPLADAQEGGVHRLAAAPGFAGIEYEKLLETNTAWLRELLVNLRHEDSDARRTALRGTIGFLRGVLGRTEGGFFIAQAADPASADGGAYFRSNPRDPDQAPPVDRILLSGANALAGAALMRAGLLLDDAATFAAGRTAVELVLSRAWRRGRGVAHTIEGDDPRLYLTTQADTAIALIDAHETSGDLRYLDAAQDIVDVTRLNLKQPGETTFRDHFPDPSPLGLLSRPRRPLRPNVRLARTMLRLAWHGRGEIYREQALEILGTHAGDLTTFGVHAIEAAVAIEEATQRPVIVRLHGEPTAVAEFRRIAATSSAPWVILATAPAADPLGSAYAEIDESGRPSKISDAAKLRERLARAARSRR